ncbi:hypothetical protein UYO_1428 [Lachnospiraceae bacterium JC7]|nr:hypothetical protein UYO_1428 [Lachnospiraceae bacterium JC7]
MSNPSANSKKHTLWHDWLTYDLIFGIVLQISVLLISVFVWHMRFPKLTFEKAAVLNMLYLTLFLPFFAGVLGLWARTNELPVWSRFFTSVSLPVLILGIISATVLCIVPPYCSSTTSQDHYMTVDNDVDPESFNICKELFPEHISSASQNTSYRYYKYSSILENDFHLSLGETLSEDRFKEESDRILSLDILKDASISSSKDITLIDTTLNGDLILHVTLDKAYNRIIYAAGYNRLR